MKPVGLAAALLLAAVSLASASNWTSFDQQAFEAARKSGKIVLLQFGERGCVVCEEQERILSRLFWSSSREDWLGFQVNMARHQDFASSIGVQSLSTLVLFRGGAELARTVGIMQDSELQAFVRKADAPEPRGRAPARPRNRRPARP